MFIVTITVSCRRGGWCFAVSRGKFDDVGMPFWESNGDVGVTSVRVDHVDIAHARGGCCPRYW